MLNVGPVKLMAEIMAAIDKRSDHLESWDDLIDHYTGPAYSESCQATEYHSENHAFEYLSLTIPTIIHDNPRVRVKSRRKGAIHKLIAGAQYHGMNRWIKDTNIRDPLVKIAYDQSFAFGVAHVKQEPNPYGASRDESPPHWPKVCRISPKCFFMDPAAGSVDEARFLGHTYVRDKQDLIDEAKADPEAGWNLEILKSLAVDVDLDRAGRAKEEDGGRYIPSRNEVVLYETWVPEYYGSDDKDAPLSTDEHPGPDQGFHGTIFTLAAGQTSDGKKPTYVRKPRPYYGPACGPYVLYGVYVVPDKPFPLAPLQAVKQQSDDLNAEVHAASEGAKDYKRFFVFDSADKELAKTIRDAKHHGIYTARGLNTKDYIQGEAGGVTDQQIKQIQLRRDRLDRNSGIHDAQRGNISGDPTATEVSVADEASTRRSAYVKREFTEKTSRVLWIAGWYLYHDDRTRFLLGDINFVDPHSMQLMDVPEFRGGLHQMGSGARYADIELEIEPYSMERVNESMLQSQFVSMSDLVASVAPVMPMTPWVKWKDWLDHGGQVFNNPHLSEVIDEQALRAASGMNGGGEEPVPRFEKAIGRGSPAQRNGPPQGAVNRRKSVMAQNQGRRDAQYSRAR